MFTWGSNTPEEQEPTRTEEPPKRPVAGLEDTVPRLPTGRTVGRVSLPEDEGLSSTTVVDEPQLEEAYEPELEQAFEPEPELAPEPEPEPESEPEHEHEREHEPPPPMEPSGAMPAEPAADVYNLHDLLNRMTTNNASDLHLNVGSPPLYRMAGKLNRLAGPPLSREMARNLLLPLLRADQLERFKVAGHHDFAYDVPDVARFRVHYFGQHFGLGSVFHRLPWTVPTLAELELPESLQNLCALRSGLIVASGASRSGKSTTVAALIDHVNHNRCEHVITLEQPIEYYHESDTCLVDHRDIGSHTNSLADGFKAVLHEQPDIVVMGDLRDAESVEHALGAVEAGILVFATMRSASVTEAVERLIGYFPSPEQDRMRSALALSLKAVLAHQLINTRPRSVLALEILICNKLSVRLVREGRLDELYDVMKNGHEEGMQTFDQALAELVAHEKLDRHVARRLANDATLFGASGQL